MTTVGNEQDRTSGEDGHGNPPFVASVMTVRVRDCDLAEHVVQLDHSPMQFEQLCSWGESVGHSVPSTLGV